MAVWNGSPEKGIFCTLKTEVVIEGVGIFIKLALKDGQPELPSESVLIIMTLHFCGIVS
jgi:hypothetical protein